MTIRRLAPLLALAWLSACGDGASTPAAPASPVAAAAAPAGQDWTQTVTKTPEGGFVMGNPAAAIKLVEYGSRTCPACGAFGQTATRPLEERYVKTGKVSYEYRDFLVHGAPDLGAALLGRCAGPQPFFPILEQMYLDQNAVLDRQMAAGNDQAFVARLQSTPPEQVPALWAQQLGYLDFVKQRGVTDAQARACLADTRAMEEIVKMNQVAQTEKNVTGTPSFFLNGEKVDGVSWPDIEARLKAAGA